MIMSRPRPCTGLRFDAQAFVLRSVEILRTGLSGETERYAGIWSLQALQSYQQPSPYIAVSLGIFGRKNPIRRICIALTESAWFDGQSCLGLSHVLHLASFFVMDSLTSK